MARVQRKAGKSESSWRFSCLLALRQEGHMPQGDKNKYTDKRSAKLNISKQGMKNEVCHRKKLNGVLGQQ